jgi:mono/diheme cytochrome c family protein
MPRRVLAASAVGVLVAFAAAVRAEEAGGSHGALFERYCAGCHGLGDRASHGTAPHLSALATRYGSPLPLAQLADFALDFHRPGGQRICGERVFARLPFTPFNDHVEREIVRAALQYVATSQQPAERSHRGER